MSYVALAAAVTLAGVAVLTAAAKCVLRRRGSFASGAGPMIAGVAGAFGVLLPAFVLFEPRHDGEPHGVSLLVVAALGALLLVTWTWRATLIIFASRRLIGSWTRRGTKIDDARWGVETIAIDTGHPVVAVAGIVRPRVFVDRSILSNCTSAELDGIAAHERAHMTRRDNLRRLLVAMCSGISSSRAAAWRQSAELAADSQAAATPRAGLDLAAALLKISRIGQPPSFDVLLLSTIHDAAPLEIRIRRLLEVHRPQPPRPRLALIWVATLFIVPLTPTVLEQVHRGIELLVRHLP
jgi:beta-lactamase regulating signal transducer with metallopeptidase domain